ncbi:hypothetical protein KFK09_009420 [Dendrobium nobile]|uniref:Homeobox domain-containing protein n=1 Tax=Dendrobium nobile TaxID=94219 RepID=A0A8T3BHF2_DENNO|nr:hypothetical protein KFK09_009420 [Dendrobium nobile]
MASSNRHWPSLFKSKPSCTSSHLQWQHDINHSSLLSAHCQKPNSYASGSEERTPEPKPRWNPKPEQIRILESIFNSGMVNPPRDEIRRIRSQLQIYGQVGDANVFYWFQNRKSRSKHKQRHLKSTAAAAKSTAPPPPPLTSVTSSSTSSSSSSGSNNKQISTIPTLSSFFDQNNLFQAPILMPELSLESSVLLPTSQPSYQLSSGELAGGSPAVWGDIILQEIMPGKNIGSVSTDSASLACVVSANMTTAMATATASTVNEIQVAKSTVFINDVAYEVIAGPLNIREAFGDEAVLLHSSGHPVLTDEWGLTLQPLQHGASYYLVQ